MKKVWVVAALLVAVSAGVVAVAEARGPRGYAGQDGAAFAGGQGYMGGGPGMMGGGRGMMGGGQGYMGGGPGMMGGGRGMMGGGRGMMGGGACLSGQAAGQNYDPALMATNAEAMLAQHKAMLTALQAQLDAATTDAVKAALTVRMERQQIQTAALEARLPVIKSLPADWLQGAILLAKQDVAFYSAATAVDETNQAFIAGHLARSQQRLTYLEAEAAKAAKSSN